MIEFRFEHEGELVTVPIDEKDLDFKDGYCSVYFAIDGFLYSGVIDENFQCVIPFVYTNKEEEFCVTTIFHNHKAIYGIKNEEFYLINLKKTEFQYKNNRLVPTNYIMKFDGYDDLNDVEKGKVIIAKNGNYFLYDISEEKQLSINFEYMEKYKNHIYGNLLFVPKMGVKSIPIDCKLDENGNIENPVTFGKFSVSYHNEILKDKDALIKEAAKTYKLIYSYNRPFSEKVQ